MPDSQACYCPLLQLGFVERFKPFGMQLQKGLAQTTQLAREKLGTIHFCNSAGAPNVDVTELPSDYMQLTEKVEKIKRLHESFTKVTRTYTLPHNDYSPPVGESVGDYAASFQHRCFYCSYEVV